MAVVKIGKQDDMFAYQGLSTDTKPSASSGSSFYEVNTGVQWVMHKGQWIEDIRLTYALIQALRELRG
jgi:hypothetical protein